MGVKFVLHQPRIGVTLVFHYVVIGLTRKKARGLDGAENLPRVRRNPDRPNELTILLTAPHFP